MRYTWLTPLLLLTAAAAPASTGPAASAPVWREWMDLPIRIAADPPKSAANDSPKTADVPAKVKTVLEHVDKHHKAPEGYEGDRHFGNFEKNLPVKDKNGKAIKYLEWDVNPHKPNVNRGPERLVTGSDGSAYYTEDHYKTFKKIRGANER